MQIHFGKNSVVDISVPQDCLVISSPKEDNNTVSEQVKQALDNPLGLPGLKECVTPEDTVTLALGEGIPHQDEIVQILIEKLVASGIKRENITVLLYGGSNQPESEKTNDPFAPQEPVEGVVKTHVHYTDQPMAYTIVSTTESGDPLAFVRPMVESDIVIPIGVADCITSASIWSNRLGLFSSIYPRFGIKDALDRFKQPKVYGLEGAVLEDIPEAVRGNISGYKPTPLDEYADLEDMSQQRWEDVSGVKDPRTQKDDTQNNTSNDFDSMSPNQIREKLAEEVRSAGWELGVVLLMEIVPGVGDSTAKICFGLPDEVEKQIRSYHQQHNKSIQAAVHVGGIGKLKFKRKPAKVLCTFNGGENRQSWNNAVETLEAAAEWGADGCPLYFCADIAQQPGKGFALIMEAADLLAGDIVAVSASLYKERFEDSITALRWLRLIEHHRIYWLSNQSDETVERLGAVPLHSAAELERLLNNADDISST